MSSRSIVVLALLASSGPVWAEGPTQFLIRAGIGGSDNVERLPNGDQKEAISIVGLDFNLDTTTRRVESQVNAELDYLTYMKNTYDSEVVGRADALLKFSLIPEHFNWVFQENFGQGQIDRYAALNPDNRENISYFSTGPDLGFEFNSNWFTTLNLRYSTVDYQVTDLGGDRYLGAFSLGRHLSSASDVSLAVTDEQIFFDQDTKYNDTDRLNVFARYKMEGARSTLEANFGATAIDNVWNDAPFTQLSYSRKISGSSTLAASIGQLITDAADSFRTADAGAAVNNMAMPGGGTPEQFKRRYLGLDWNYLRNRTDLVTYLRYSVDEYHDSPELNDTRWDLQSTYSRQMTPTLALRAFLTWMYLDYSNVNIEDSQFRYGVGISWNFGRKFGLLVDLERFDRHVKGADSGFDENRGFMSLQYRIR